MSNKDNQQAGGTASDKDAAKGTEGTGGAAQAGTSTSTDGKDSKDSTKDTSGKDAAKDAAPRGRANQGKASRDAAEKDAAGKPTIHTRHHDVRLNRTDREQQIARADEALNRRDADNEAGARVLADREQAEEAKYADHDKLPPPTGKAFNTVTPTHIDDNGERHW